MGIGLPSAAHFIFIPSVLILGVVIGWILGGRAAKDAYAAELKRREEAVTIRVVAGAQEVETEERDDHAVARPLVRAGFGTGEHGDVVGVAEQRIGVAPERCAGRPAGPVAQCGRQGTARCRRTICESFVQHRGSARCGSGATRTAQQHAPDLRYRDPTASPLQAGLETVQRADQGQDSATQ